MIEDRITKALEERFSSEDLNSCFLVHVEASKNNKITVFVESDDRLTIDMCRIISRFLEKRIEEEQWLPEKYTLDVSSPGLDNPLRLRRQYIKNIGRSAKVKLSDGSVKKGKIKEITDDTLVIEMKNNKLESVNFDEIDETKILVSFK